MSLETILIAWASSSCCFAAFLFWCGLHNKTDEDREASLAEERKHWETRR